MNINTPQRITDFLGVLSIASVFLQIRRKIDWIEIKNREGDAQNICGMRSSGSNAASRFKG